MPHETRLELKSPASRQDSRPLAGAHNGKKTNAEAGLFKPNPSGAVFLGDLPRSSACQGNNHCLRAWPCSSSQKELARAHVALFSTSLGI